MELSRNCSECFKLISYNDKSNFRRALKKNSPCSNCSKRKGHSLGTKIKISSKQRPGVSIEQIIKELTEPVPTRNCPKCGKLLTYTRYSTFKNAEDKNILCRSCNIKGERSKTLGKKFSNETKTNMSIAQQKIKRCGEKNVRFGKNFYTTWIEKYGKEEADRKYEIYHNKMLDRVSIKGNSNSLFSAYQGWYKDWFFRSSKELNFALHLDVLGLNWKSAEKIHINYEFEGKTKRYSPDFLVEENTIVEIKDKSPMNKEKTKAKEIAGKKYCKQKGFSYRLTDFEGIKLDKMNKLEELGIIKLSSRPLKRIKKGSNKK